jgi:hypothetical protein
MVRVARVLLVGRTESRCGRRAAMNEVVQAELKAMADEAAIP